MGMFDNVIVDCDKCGEEMWFQTKSGPCTLNVYRVSNTPGYILASLDGSIEKCECGNYVKFPSYNKIEIDENEYKELLEIKWRYEALCK